MYKATSSNYSKELKMKKTLQFTVFVDIEVSDDKEVFVEDIAKGINYGINYMIGFNELCGEVNKHVTVGETSVVCQPIDN